VSGNNIYYTAGNVGIWTVNSGTKLEVAGALTIGVYTLPSADGTSGYTLKTDGHGTVSWEPDVEGSGGSGDGYSLDAQDSSPQDALFVDANGNVGIGTTTPGALLDVNGPINIGAYTLPAADGFAGYILITNGNGTVSWQQDPLVAELAAKADQAAVDTALAAKAGIVKTNDFTVAAMETSIIGGLALTADSRGMLMVYIIPYGGYSPRLPEFLPSMERTVL
jgi:hypothetical protein